jgi:hypothetical protein
LVLALPAAPAAAGGASFELQAMRAGRAVRVDGQLDEAEWKDASRVDGFTQFEPHRGEPAREKTEAYVLYDDRYLYIGFRCHDSEPSRITAQLNRRDSDLLTDDAVLAVIDTFHDSRSAYFFATNPLGTQYDGRVTDNGRVVESTWDADWNAASARFEGGWTAEIAIPLVSLRFHSGKSETWGLNLGRTCRRLLEVSFWAGPLEDRFRISQYGTLSGLDLESAQRRLQVIPYALGQFQQDAASDYQAGGDLRFALTPENLVNVTFNPDFATVEADQEQVNLTRFELSLPEKRQFFLEGSELYRQRIQTFYSRRIADIRAGAKILGRNRGWQYAALGVASDPLPVSGSPGAESATYSVFRLQKDVLKSSTVALMAGDRFLDGVHRGSVGLDTALYLTRTFGFTGQLIRSHGPEEGGRWAFFVRPSRDTSTSHVHFRYTHLGERFGDHVNAIGFIRDDDRREMDSAVTKDFWFRAGTLEHVDYRSNYNIYWSQRNVLRSWQIDQEVGVDFRNRWRVEIGHTSEFKLFEKEFRNHVNGVRVGYNLREWQSVAADYQFGRNFDSRFDLIGVSFRRKLSDAFSVEYQLDRLRLDPDPEGASTAIHVIRAVHNFTRDLFVKFFFQTNTAIDRNNVQAVFVWRYKPPFGSFQLAYQRGTAAFGQRSEQGNTLFVKLSYVL